MKKKICVLGAGIVGICTAWQAREQFGDDYQIYVVADNFEDKTVSASSTGIFEPLSPEKISDNFEELWMLSWDFYIDLMKSKEAGKTGISFVDGFRCHQTAVPDEVIAQTKKLVYNFKEIEPTSLPLVDDITKINKVYQFTTLMLECSKFLPWASEVLINKGVKFLNRHIDNFQELANGGYDIIFNCSGLGSRKLAKDYILSSVRGQIVKVNAPWIKQFYNFVDEETSVYPGQDGCVVGSTFQIDNEDPEPCKNDTNTMLKRAAGRIPSLENASIQIELVGFRPNRSAMRMEKGNTLTNKFDNRQVRIFHNYG